MDYKKIALFGGTFDPVHMGHLIIAEWVMEELALDRIFFVPNLIHPFNKRKYITPAHQRLRMLELALRGYKRFAIEDVELKRQGTSYAIDTIKYFIDKAPSAQLFYLIGADNLPDFEKWKDPQKIKELTNLVVYKRNLNQPVPDSQKNVLFMDSPIIDISSSKIRARIAEGKSCRSMLPAGVYDYIREHRLYKSYHD